MIKNHNGHNYAVFTCTADHGKAFELATLVNDYWKGIDLVNHYEFDEQIVADLVDLDTGECDHGDYDIDYLNAVEGKPVFLPIPSVSIKSSTLLRLIDEAMDDYTSADGQLELYIHERGWQEWMGAFPEDQPQLITDTLTTIFTYARGGSRAVREELGLTQVMFAEAFGVSRRTVEDWETGRRNMPRHLLALILRASHLLPVEVSSL